MQIKISSSAGLTKGVIMRSSISHLALLAAGTFVFAAGQARAQALETGIKNIETVVVIYAENRSFDNEYGSFPGANGLQNVTPSNSTQVDRDGSVLKELPPAWGLDRQGCHAAGHSGAD